MSAQAAPTAPLEKGSRLVSAAICCLGLSAVFTQLSLMREMLGAFGGSETVLGVILGNWLLLTGIGCCVGRRAGRLRNPVRALVAAEILISLIPVAQVFGLRVLRDVVFTRGAMIGVSQSFAASLLLLAPYCLLSGYMLTVACSFLAGRLGPAGTARVYLSDALGSVAGGVAFTFVLVRSLDHIGILYWPAMLNLAMACLLAWRFRIRPLAGLAAALAAGVLAVIVSVDLDAISTALQYPGQRVLFRGNSPYGRLIVTETSGQVNFIENGLPVITTDNLEQVEETVHFAMAQRPDARSVLLVSGGVAGTAREILKYGLAEVTYVELDPLIIEAARPFLPGSLDDARISVVNADGREFIRRTGRQYDVVIVDLPDPSTFQINRFYTAEFFAEVKRRLSPGGVLSFSLGRYANYLSEELARMLASAEKTLRLSFANVLTIPAGQVFFLASDGPLHEDIADRIERLGVRTLLVNRNYLDAMLTGDRLGEIRRAAGRPAEANRDFSPILYYYHLLYWISQFRMGFGLLEAALLAVLAIYLLRLRAVPMAVLAGGFAASGLEVVLLLGFQVLRGSVYHRVGLVVTAFMAGLAAGAFLSNRLGGPACSDARGQGGQFARRRLGKLALAIAAYGGLLPTALLALGRLGGSGALGVAIEAAVAMLTFVLAGLVGMEFPQAARAEFVEGALTGSRLYTADFVGACIGALLTSTLLVPLAGVMWACMAAAGLNLLAGGRLLVAGD